MHVAVNLNAGDGRQWLRGVDAGPRDDNHPKARNPLPGAGK